jgi:acyl-CoA thioesterase-1
MQNKIPELIKSERPLTWVFTGDSITHGARYTYGWRDYVQLFEERLRFEIERLRDIVIRSAISGWTTQYILDDIEHNILRFNPDIVSIMVGMNDAAAGPSYVDTFEQNYRRILSIVREKTHAEIILHTPNPITPAGEPSREPALPLLAETVRKLGKELGLLVVDHDAHYREAWAEIGYRATVWMGDAIHPNEYGHRAFACLLMRELGMWDDMSDTCRLFIP